MQSRIARGFIFFLLIVALSVLLPAAAQEEGSELYTVGVQLMAEGLSSPVFLTSANDGSGRLFIVDQAGTIRVLSPDGQLMPDPFLDLSGQLVPLDPNYDERGVLGLAFHPDYANNGRIFVYYTAPLRPDGPAGWDHTNVLAEVNVSPDNPDVADLNTLIPVLQIDQPQFNHDAGHIAFGPDGFLYVPIGDGGGANDVDEGHTPDLGNGQDLTNLHGSILRIDVNGAPGTYAIPPDNPFVSNPEWAPEIFAFGLRNPYHISFDWGGNGELFVADAGQDLYEEVDIVTAGGNYGWNIKEGTHCFDPNNPETPPAECATTGANGEPLIDPIIEYTHEDVGLAVIGGYVYRGSAMPEFQGLYIFGDYTRGGGPAANEGFGDEGEGQPDGAILWAAPSSDSPMWAWGEMSVAGLENNRIGGYVLGFGQDDAGELYVMTNFSPTPMGDTGMVWKLIPAEAGTTTGPAESGESSTGSTSGDVSEPTAAPAEPAEPVEPAAPVEPTTVPGYEG